MMISGPVPDWIAEVMRACRSLALMVSTLSVMPVAFWHSCVIWPLSSTSEAGTKSAQRSQWTVVPCAKAGARPVARTAARPPVCAATAPDADSFRSLRRVMRAMCFPLSLLCAGIERARLRRCARRGVVCQPGASRPERPAECSRVRRRSRIRRFSPNRTRNLGAGRRAHPGLMPATWTTQVQRLSLPGIVASDSSGVMPITSTPRLGEALRLGVKPGKAWNEHMFSAFTPGRDRRPASSIGSFVPNSAIASHPFRVRGKVEYWCRAHPNSAGVTSMKSTLTARLRSLAGAALAAGVVASMPVGAETLVEQVTDTRLVLAFRVDPAELQKVFPGPWDIVGTAAGPAKDANFNVIFYDRMLQQDGAGASMGPPYRFIVFAAGVKPKEASSAASVVGRIYASDPKRVPGPYKNSLLSTVERRTVIESGSSEPGTNEETWEVRAPPNHTISLSVKYEKSTPARQKSEGKVYSSVDTAFYRIYRWDLLAEVAKSATAGIDRVKNYKFNASVPDYANLLTSAQLVAIISQPMYVRNVWLP